MGQNPQTTPEIRLEPSHVDRVPLPRISSEPITSVLPSAREVQPGVITVITCGDERKVVKEVEDSATGQTTPGTPEETLEGVNTLRVYGSAPTFCEHILTTVSIMARANSEDLQEYLARHDITGFATFVEDTSIRLLVNADTVSTVHSAVNNEQQDTFNHDLPDSANIGCARNGNHSAVSQLSADHDGVRAESAAADRVLFEERGGITHDELVAAICAAKHTELPRKVGDIALGRGFFKAANLPVVMCIGSHQRPEDTEIFINASLDHYIPPDGTSYVIDIARAAEAAMKAWPELNLDPVILMRVIMHDTVATKAALKGGSQSGLDITVVGNLEDALTRLRDLQVSQTELVYA